jgi:hypothetical protein
MKTRLKANPVPIVRFPIGAEENFAGVVDLVKMKAIYWDEASQGMKFDYRRDPGRAPGRQAKKWREKMVEAAAEANEELMNKYLENGELSEGRDHPGPASAHDRVRDPADAVRHRVQEQGRAAHARRRHRLPALAVDIPPVKGSTTTTRKSSRGRRREKFSALAFKLMTDPFVGQLTFVRVYSGVLSVRRDGLNSIKNKKERIGRLLQMHANEREEIKEVRAGDIAAVRRPEGSDDRRDAVRPDAPIILERMEFPDPVISQAVEPKTKATRRRWASRWASGAGRSVVPRAHRRGVGPDHHLRHGRAAPRDHRRPDAARVRRRGQRRQAAGRLSRGDSQGRRAGRQVRQAVRRPRPVRPRLDQARAERAGQGLRVRRRDQGRRGAARVHPRGDKGCRTPCPTACWPASRWST